MIDIPKTLDKLSREVDKLNTVIFLAKNTKRQYNKKPSRELEEQLMRDIRNVMIMMDDVANQKKEINFCLDCLRSAGGE